MRSIPEATAIDLTQEERAALEGLVRSTKTQHRLRQRARIVLLAADSMATRAIGRAVGCTTGTASKWRVRFAELRLDGLSETGNRGAEPKYTDETNGRILALLDNPPPAGHGRWSGPLIAKALGDVDVQYVWRFLRAHKIDLAGRKSWCQSNDPDFAAKAAEIVGLYLNPPENALVLAVDEKPSIQALERAQGYLKLPNGRALTGQSHHYKRHGTTTLFAAFDVATGEVTGRQYKRRRRIEFLDFMNRIVKANEDREIHVILDNLSTHKPKCDRWLKRHPDVHFHFTPTSASWLNQVEIWFSILAGKSLKGASFNGLQDLKDHIDGFIKTYNKTARPFAWTKSKVHQKRLKPRFTDQ
ncbi:MAG: IS630 family transposase [Gammaproteobacteria bacterium]|nr:IS630 family transposase [Gammaproteobacteria bacterium]